jgi:hypothetical protein
MPITPELNAMSNANDKIAAQKNIKDFADSLRLALEHLHSKEIDRQMSHRFDTDKSVHQFNTDVIQIAFDAAMEAFEKVKDQAYRLGVEVEEPEF